MKAVGIIFSNIHDNNVPELVRIRTLGSIPFGGRYRLIDFPLSNMVNSGIDTVGIITKSNYQSLIDHVGSGKDWDLARKDGGVIILPPFGDNSSKNLYTSRLEALKGITNFLFRADEDYVVMTDCDSVSRINYNDVIEAHIRNRADITLVYKKCMPDHGSEESAITFDMVDNRIVGINQVAEVSDERHHNLKPSFVKLVLQEGIPVYGISSANQLTANQCRRRGRCIVHDDILDRNSTLRVQTVRSSNETTVRIEQRLPANPFIDGNLGRALIGIP